MSPLPQPGKSRSTAPAHAWAVVRRGAQFAVAASHAVLVFGREWLRRRGQPGAAAGSLGRALVELCTALGATFVKIGQIASTRADLLPRPLIAELATLQDRLPAFAFADVRRTIEAEFGRPLEDLFASFEPVPVAAASVAQVHRAVWRETGEVVAVKVRRPDILEKARLDRFILLASARVLERLVPSLRLVSLEDAMRNFCSAVEAQIHLRNEAANNLRFARNFADDPDVHFPRLYPAACSDAVLTMEFVDGWRESELEGADVDPLRIALNGLRCVCRMIFSHGFVHADLHPGNMRFQPSGRVVLLDLGLTGSMNDEDRLSMAQTLYAFASGDGATVARLFHDHSPQRATPDYPAYEREIVELVDGLRRRGLGSVQITLEIGRIFDILRRHHIRARSHTTMVNLALMTAEGLGKRLAPQLSLAEAALPYLAEALAARPPSGPTA